jgi:hypothetical protein
MKLKDEANWNKWVENNTDPYGLACINVARRVMEILEEDHTPLENGYHPNIHTAHGIICKADDEVKAGGISGYMASVVAQMVFVCHERGSEFKDSHNGDVKAEGVINHAIITIKE